VVVATKGQIATEAPETFRRYACSGLLRKSNRLHCNAIVKAIMDKIAANEYIKRFQP
jgi:hypothetical protein